jgi:hypothetical protein
MGTLLGSMEYCCWARAEVEKSVVAKMAAEILNEGISRTVSSFEFIEMGELRIDHCKERLLVVCFKWEF